VGASHFVEATIFAGAYDEPRTEGAASDNQFVCHFDPLLILNLPKEDLNTEGAARTGDRRRHGVLKIFGETGSK
jgi:hypothetical protein